MYEKIPQELKLCKNWVGWKAVPDKDDPSHFGKIPVCVSSGENASSTFPGDWEDFETAVNSRYRNQLGFVFTDSPFFGVDIDRQEDALNAFLNGDTDNIIGEFVTGLQSYAELSPSGKGVHIICKGTLPGGANRRGCVEMYDTGRFFTVTGKCIADYPAADCTETVKPLFEKYLGSQSDNKTTEQRAVPSQIPAGSSTPQISFSISERLEKAKQSKRSGAKFSDLMAGKYEGWYKSHSEADMALCNMLAFWLDKNAADMDSVFRTSGLMRDKWNRKQSGSTYGALTVQKAVSDCTATYSDYSKQKSNYSITVSGAGEPVVSLEQNLKEYSFDDTGNSERLRDIYGERLKYCYETDTWFYWNHKNWEQDLTGTIDRVVDDSLSVLDKERILYADDPDTLKRFQKHIHNSRSLRAKKAMRTDLQHRVPILYEKFDNIGNLFNTPDGIIDLDTCKLYPHDKKLLLSKIAGTHISSGDCPVWKSLIRDLLGGNEGLMDYMQKVFGYSMLAKNPEQCFFILLGNGGNGKSTMLAPIREIFGGYAANVQAETLMVSANMSAGAARSDLARLKGVRFAHVSEPAKGHQFNESLMKQVTGGDKITTRFQYGRDFEYSPYFKMLIPANYPPIIVGTDNGIWRRVRVIPFKTAFSEDKADKSMPDKLRKELPMIFGWVLEGLKMYHRDGLRSPPEVLDAVKSYRCEMDVISAFIGECCVVTPSVSESAACLYSAFCRWAESNDMRMVSRQFFSKEISERDGVERQHKEGGTVYRGITILENRK